MNKMAENIAKAGPFDYDVLLAVILHGPSLTAGIRWHLTTATGGTPPKYNFIEVPTARVQTLA